MLILDDILLGGLQFVMRRIAETVDAELTDDKVYREELLAAQMRLELGEITEGEFAAVETDMLAKIREVRERQGVATPASVGAYKLESVEVSGPVEHEEEAPPEAREARSQDERRGALPRRAKDEPRPPAPGKRGRRSR